jgi:hypothetical protein
MPREPGTPIAAGDYWARTLIGAIMRLRPLASDPKCREPHKKLWMTPAARGTRHIVATVFQKKSQFEARLTGH